MAEFSVVLNVLRVKGLEPGSTEDALEKWEYLHNLCRQGYLVKDGGRWTCSYCQAYQRMPYLKDCRGCPIAGYTGNAYCLNTPYQDYCEAMVQHCSGMATEAAAGMVDLLENLLLLEQLDNLEGRLDDLERKASP